MDSSPISVHFLFIPAGLGEYPDTKTTIRGIGAENCRKKIFESIGILE